VDEKGMEDETVIAVAAILSKWNPVGDALQTIDDLDGFRTEAIDIIFHLELQHSRNEKQAAKVVRDVLNEAFDLDLTIDACLAPAREILLAIRRGHRPPQRLKL
jgi:hypothetical protein